MKFKPGMRVRLIGHSLDSHVNLEVGARGTVLAISAGSQQPVEVEWDNWRECPTWWVADDIIRPVNMQLENK